MKHGIALLVPVWVCGFALAADYDVVIRDGTVYDGTGAPGYKTDIAIRGDRIAGIGDFSEALGALEIDATDLAVAPGFFNLLSHARGSLLSDGRAMSDVLQGVTFEVLSESSVNFEPSNTAAERDGRGGGGGSARWSSLDEYLEVVEESGVSPNFATFISAAVVRTNVLGRDDVDPSPEQLEAMKAQVERAMQDGALGLTTALIYAPATFAETEELIELAKVAGSYGGIYTAHIRSEGNQFLEAIEETVRIGREAKLPVKIHHLKAAGRPNWHKAEEAIDRIEELREEGLPITADMYTYIAGGTGLSASLPPWVNAGGGRDRLERLRDPELRARVKAEMAQNSSEWENLGFMSGPEGMMCVSFPDGELKKYEGKTIAAISKERGTDPQDTIIDLVIDSSGRIGTIYYLMNEENLKLQIRQPWVMFGSDAEAPAAEGETLDSGAHPRTYGTFARLLGKYVREEGVISLEEAIRRLTLLPAQTLKIQNRGRLAPGHFADVAVFDPETIQDRATFESPHQYATGVVHVIVNGIQVVKDGEHTGATPGRAIRGPGWAGHDPADS